MKPALRRFPAVFLAAVSTLALMGSVTAGAAGETPERPRFSTDPALSPAFGWNRSDYAIRCSGVSVAVEVDAQPGWSTQIGSSKFRTGDFTATPALRPGRAFAVRFRREGKIVRAFHVRCLPADFPQYRFQGHWRGGPRLMVIQMASRYAAAFDRNGAPVWWYKAPEGGPNNSQLLPDGTFAYAPVEGITFRRFHVRSLTGRPIRIIEAADGAGTDIHDLILLPNGNYLLGAHQLIRGIDATRFGGEANATIDTSQLQELTPSGKLVWKWNAWPRVGLAETGRWWKTITQWGQPYDVHHWNSIERSGRSILLSFRHLDAVLRIDRQTKRIIWKLGGTKTSKRLRVHSDPFSAYPFGGQHDARFQPDGTVTVLDNATNLKRMQPRAVQYRINPVKRTATLVQQITDPKVGISVGMASARLYSDNWFIGWGAMPKTGVAGGYTPGEDPLFRLYTPGNITYRMNPVIAKRPTTKQLRRAMNSMAAQGR